MLQLGHKDYSLNHLQVKQSLQLPSFNKPQQTYQTSVLHKNSLYLYSWPDTCWLLRLHSHTEKHEKSEAPTQLKMDKDSSSNFNLSDYSLCHGSAILNNELYLLVSQNQYKLDSPPVSTMIKLNLTSGLYSHVNTSGQPPSLRNGSLVESISNMYVLVYGGMDVQNKLPLSDAYALIFWEWKKLKIVNPIEPRTHFATTTNFLKNKVYLYGGQMLKNDQKTYISDFYEITFSDTKKQLTFEQIHYSMGRIPTPRSNHKMVSVSQRYLVLFGGVTQDKNNQGSEGTMTMKDFWVFDFMERKWTEVEIELQKFNINSLFSSTSHLNEFFIFGAFQNVKSGKKSDLIRLQFGQKINKKSGTSLNQQLMSTKPKENLEGSSIEFSTSLIHNTSYLIKFPFQAIQRIIQFAENQNANIIKIYSEYTTNTIDKYIYISIDIKTSEDIEPSNNFEVEVQKLFIYCLRMGKTAVYVQNYKKTGERKVYLMSADGRFAPLLQRLQLFYTYTEISNDSGLLSVQNCRNKQIINTILEGIIGDPQSLIRSIEGGKIMIFTPNIIPTPKSYFYELVFDSLLDISLFKNNKKLELLDKVKYDLANSMEFSLHSYLKYSNTTKVGENKSKTQIFLSKSINPVPQDKSYADYLEQFSKLGKITKVKFPQNSCLQHTDSYHLYACHQDFYMPENNGILLYQNGKLVNRYECQFGRLLQDKFYQKKIQKEARNVFVIAGEIHLSNKLGLINFGTEFQKTSKFMEFQISLQTLVTNFLQKMESVPKITRNSSKEAKNSIIMANQNISIESNGYELKSNQVVQPEKNNQFEVDGDENEQFQEENPHKKIKSDDKDEDHKSQQN